MADIKDFFPIRRSNPYFIAYEEQPNGTNSADLIDNDVYIDRTLNTYTTNITGASLSSNVITMPAGIYYVFGMTPTFDCAECRAYLRTTANAILMRSINSFCSTSTSRQHTDGFLTGQLSLASSSSLKLSSYTQSGPQTSGSGGRATDSGSYTNIYSFIQFYKVDEYE